MDNWVVAMMLGASLLLGGTALIAFLWGLKNGQFDVGMDGITINEERVKQ
ncbi:MAG: cbb3-type cytochrome oxidase assembly protein CcoS, partial [Sulfurimonas sp.]